MEAMTKSGTKAGVASGERGFTLLEILVATAILGTAVAALFGLLSSSLGNARKLQAPSQALLLGRSLMNQLIAESAYASGGTALSTPLDEKIQGRFNEQFRWEARATRSDAVAQTSPGQPILARMVLDIFWKSDPGKPEKKLTFETYQLREPTRPVQ
jgi:prepilin-type N-terminal cleavage/methylation domain-containing protein